MSDDQLDAQPPNPKLILEYVPIIDDCTTEDPELPSQPTRRPSTRALLPNALIGDFEEFWHAYPRKVNKGDARGRYAKAVEDGADPAAILAAAAKEFQSFCKDTGREQRFIRHAGRWLLEASWKQGLPFADAPPRLKHVDPPTADELALLEAVPHRSAARTDWPAVPRDTRRRANILARAYCILQPLSSQHAVERIVERAIAAGRWHDKEIGWALAQMAKADRKVTADSLRNELLYRLTERRREREVGELNPECVVYLIKADESPLVKIGTSEAVPERLHDLQRSCPVELRILHTIPGSYELENALHREFRSRRRHGEWFDFSDVDPIEAVTRRLPHVLKALEAQQSKPAADAA
ncbi:MAG: GIY-YIG nuclease family protein [Streptomyces sp.]|nr:GIY-YIG nuclease family protein [Streptomyces sp.]